MANKNKSAKYSKDNKAVKNNTNDNVLVIDFTEGYTPINTSPITREEIENLRTALAKDIKLGFWQKIKKFFSIKRSKK